MNMEVILPKEFKKYFVEHSRNLDKKTRNFWKVY
jgi:hypothetical protein